MTIRYVVYGLHKGYLKQIASNSWQEVEKPEEATPYPYDVALAVAMKFGSQIRPSTTRGLS